MTESTPYKCVNCFLGLTPMQTWKFADVSPLCVSCYDSLCEQKRAKQPEPLVDCITANLALPRYYGKQPAVLPETLPAGVRSKHGFTALGTVKLGDRAKGTDGIYWGGWSNDATCGIIVDFIDWSSVPIQEAKPAALPSIRLPWMDIDWASTLAQVQRAIAQTQEQADADVAAVFAYEATLKPATCRDCSAPATHAAYCVYCAERNSSISDERNRADMDSRMISREARARMLAADERERPRVTKAMRELAKAHTWECDE